MRLPGRFEFGANPQSRRKPTLSHMWLRVFSFRFEYSHQDLIFTAENTWSLSDSPFRGKTDDSRLRWRCSASICDRLRDVLSCDLGCMCNAGQSLQDIAQDEAQGTADRTRLFSARNYTNRWCWSCQWIGGFRRSTPSSTGEVATRYAHNGLTTAGNC